MANSPANQRLGRFVVTSVGGETVRAFVPPPLPPSPGIDVASLAQPLEQAGLALGALNGVTRLLPNMELFLYMYVRKEAVLSSQIEGTQSTLSDLLRFETEALAGKPVDDIREVCNYVDAMVYGLDRLKTLPLSLRLLRETHGRLLRSGRGQGKDAGHFRRSQNWLGGTRPGNALFVPPPINELEGCLHALETFMHEEGSRLPALIKAGLIHVQFETIHPFLDGNGRMGRLLITLFLCVQGVLRAPLLYLSLFLKTRRAQYYRLLQEVREHGAWEAWLEFFLEGVTKTATQACAAGERIVELFEADREAVRRQSSRVGSALGIHDQFQWHPYLSANKLMESTGLSAPTVNAALAELVRFGVLEEVTGRRRGRVFAYGRYLAILSEGTDPLPPGQ